MVKIIITLLLCTILYSCSAPYYRLADGRKVIKSKYKNITNQTISTYQATSYWLKMNQLNVK